GPLRDRGLALAQGRHAPLGQCDPHAGLRPQRAAARLRQGDARPDRAPQAGGGAAAIGPRRGGAAAARRGPAHRLPRAGGPPAADATAGSWDRLRLEQVLVNLLSNAIKYGAGRPVEVTVRRDGEEALLIVRDHGPGIPPGDLARIFGRFERAASMRNYGGMGL